MSRIGWLTAAIVGAAALADARHAKSDAALSKSMTESLSKIAAPFMDKAEIAAMTKLSAPKDDMLSQIDAMQKQIMSECNQEASGFATWLAAKQADLLNDQQQVAPLQAHQSQLQQHVDQINGQINSLQNSQTDLQTKLKTAQTALNGFNQQLQAATDLRTKMHNQNQAIIQQHTNALQVLANLRAMVAGLNTTTDAVLAQLQDVSFLHKKTDHVRNLIDSVKKQLVRAQAKDPQIKGQLKSDLLALIDRIANGVKESLQLYQSQEIAQQQKFDNEIRPGLEQMIAQAQAQIDSFQSQLAQLAGSLSSLANDLKQAQSDLDQATNQVQTLLSLIASIQSQIQSATDGHAQKQARCRADLNALEQVRQYIVNNVQGMTPGNNCNPQSPDCDRCLYNEQCSNGQICSDRGACIFPATTMPPKRPYYQLLPKSPPTGWQQGRQVDVGVVPPSSFSLSDFTYIFKYQQLQPANGWSNLFNVLNVGNGFPFPNQAALFLAGNTFEIDVCQNGLAWPASYWYRNFYLQQVDMNQWTAVAFVVSSSTKTVTFTFRDGSGKVRSQAYPDFHGRPAMFPQTGAWVNGRGYNPLVANFADFRRYDSALGPNDVLSVFNEFFS